MSKGNSISPTQLRNVLAQMAEPGSVRRGKLGGRSFEVEIAGEERRVSLNEIIQCTIDLMEKPPINPEQVDESKPIHERIGIPFCDFSLVQMIRKVDVESCTHKSGLFALAWRILHYVRSIIFRSAAQRETLYQKIERMERKILQENIIPLESCDLANDQIRLERKSKEANVTYISVTSPGAGYALISSLPNRRPPQSNKDFLNSLSAVHKAIGEVISSKPEVPCYLVNELGKLILQRNCPRVF